MLKKWLSHLWHSSYEYNRKNILDLIDSEVLEKKFGTDSIRILDVGCDDGAFSVKLGQPFSKAEVCGIEINEDRGKLASEKGVKVSYGDLSKGFPFEKESFHFVHANQVIEHVPDVDFFTAEIYRMLQPGGLVICSTENTSSWHNIFSSLWGWQIFSSANLSGKAYGIGNPLAILRGQEMPYQSWTHKVLFGYRGLIEFFQAHGFDEIAIKGSGYHPLPVWFGNLDVRHSHFITLKGYKKENP